MLRRLTSSYCRLSVTFKRTIMARLIRVVPAAVIGLLMVVAFAFAGGWLAPAATAAPDAVQPSDGATSLDATLAITNDCRYGIIGSQDANLTWLASQNVG